MSSSKGKMKSDYASVTDQAGIYAGDGGFVINTAETTSLTGAVIDSTADTNKINYPLNYWMLKMLKIRQNIRLVM